MSEDDRGKARASRAIARMVETALIAAERTRRAERADVVAYLRRWAIEAADRGPRDRPDAVTVDELADAIERGEHARRGVDGG